MTARSNFSVRGGALISFGLALSLAACGGQDERTYESDASDVSEGELIVNTPSPGAPEPELPDTPMTPVPEDAVEADQNERAQAE